MADDSPAHSARSAEGVTIPRGVLIGAAIGTAVLLVAVGVLIGVLLGGSSKPPAAASDPPAVSAPPKHTSPGASDPPEPAKEPLPPTFAIGEPVTVGPVTLTVNAVEVATSVATNDGIPLTPDAGGQLVVFHTTYVNSKNQADLSCGNTDLYIQVYDESGLEMAPVFENSRLPGNPTCNAHQLQNQPHEWTFVFQSVAGATPTIMSLLETLSYNQQELILLQ